MAAKRFAKIKTDDRDVNLVQDNVKKSLDSVTSNALLGGHLVQQVPLVTGTTLVSHGLGRNFVSWLAGNLSAPATLSAGASPDPSKWIGIVSTAPCSADLYVF